MNGKINILKIVALAVLIALVAVVCGIAGWNFTPAHALGTSCIENQANYAPDSLVKNGHALNDENQSDLFTRHLTCENTATKSEDESVSEKSQPQATEVPSTSSTEIPPQVTSAPPTPQPTEVHQDDPTPAPTSEGSDPQTTDKPCKNKNQYKEGTSDCNAGKGNG